jgi:hypothetical protein
VVSVEHIGEDDLENYAMRTLPESSCAALEEHLLICEDCRERLDSEIEFVTAMRSAAARTIKERDGGCDAASAGHPRTQRFRCHTDEAKYEAD